MENESLSKKQFANLMLKQIEGVAATHPYHAFVLMAALNEFARFELGIIVFESKQINTGLNYMLTHYRPLKLWLTHEETEEYRHLEPYKGLICLEVNKTFEQMKAAISEVEISEDKFIEV